MSTPACQSRFLAYLLGWISERENVWFKDASHLVSYKRGKMDYALALAQEKGPKNEYSRNATGKNRFLTSADSDYD